MFKTYVTVSNLTQIELPPNEYTSGIIVVPIPGISMERSRDPTCQNNGCFVFLINNVLEEFIHLKNH